MPGLRSRLIRPSTFFFSQSSNLCLKRTFQRLFKQFGRHKARKFSSSFSLELRYTFIPTIYGNFVISPVDHRGPSSTAADHAVARLQFTAQYSRRSRQGHRHHDCRELLFSSRALSRNNMTLIGVGGYDSLAAYPEE
jgi:uncharacterized protein (DUF1810 family)